MSESPAKSQSPLCLVTLCTALWALAAPIQAHAADIDGVCATGWKAPGYVPVPGAGGMAASKGAAILGGMPSRLAQLSAQQSGGIAPLPSIASAPVAPISPLAMIRDPLPIAVLGPSRMAFAPGGRSLAPALVSMPSIQVDCVTPSMAVATAPVVRPAVFLPAAPQRTDRPDVFGSVALAVSRTPFDARWRRVSAGGLPGAGPWAPVLRRADALDRAAQLTLVNQWVNARIAFVDDARARGSADHWATPAESLGRGRGDCEDYAIAKHGMLRALGVPASEMFLVIARDLVRRADHAVLAVRLGGRLVILDNETDRILDSEQVRDYRPVMSYAAGRSWTHGYRIDRDPMTAPLRTAAAGITAGR